MYQIFWTWFFMQVICGLMSVQSSLLEHQALISLYRVLDDATRRPFFCASYACAINIGHLGIEVEIASRFITV